MLIHAAQTVGQLPLSLRQVPADAVAAPGHKGLLGPLGTMGTMLGPLLLMLIEVMLRL